MLEIHITQYWKYQIQLYHNLRTPRYVNSPCDGLYTRCLNNTPPLKPTPKITSPIPTITTSMECKAILFLKRCKAPYQYVYPTYPITTCQIGYCQAGLMCVNSQTLPQRRTRFRRNARYENKDCKEQEENGFCQSQIRLDIKEGLVTDENITSTCDEKCSYYKTDIYLTPTDLTNCNISKEDQENCYKGEMITICSSNLTNCSKFVKNYER